MLKVHCSVALLIDHGSKGDYMGMDDSLHKAERFTIVQWMQSVPQIGSRVYLPGFSEGVDVAFTVKFVTVAGGFIEISDGSPDDKTRHEDTEPVHPFSLNEREELIGMGYVPVSDHDPFAVAVDEMSKRAAALKGADSPYPF